MGVSSPEVSTGVCRFGSQLLKGSWSSGGEWNNPNMENKKKNMAKKELEGTLKFKGWGRGCWQLKELRRNCQSREPEYSSTNRKRVSWIESGLQHWNFLAPHSQNLPPFSDTLPCSSHISDPFTTPYSFAHCFPCHSDCPLPSPPAKALVFQELP